jgi:hypothetical protein
MMVAQASTRMGCFSVLIMINALPLADVAACSLLYERLRLADIVSRRQL